MSLAIATTHSIPNQTDAQVTIVVVPRERFSCTQKSLESIYQHTTLPFNLVYIDGHAPPKVQRYLEKQAQEKSFHLIRTPCYLYPNQARNLGLAHVTTPYVVFVDNDVIVSPGWLEALMGCAKDTEATVVGPLMCQHEPIHEEIHFAGGESHLWVDKKGRRRLREKMYQQGQSVEQLHSKLCRTQTELAEFHCVLVRRDIFDRIGVLDEQMLNTKEHLDFCMTVIAAGGTVYFEPQSLVTYVPGAPEDWTDLHYYMLRWSDAWTLASLHRLRDKWQLAEDGYFQSKYKKIGWRRKMTILIPLNRFLTLGVSNRLLNPLLLPLDRWLNRLLTDRHAHQQIQNTQFTSLLSSKSPSPTATPSHR
jgi:GT2 family glycosyltransferase